LRTKSVETVGVVTTLLERWVDNTVVSPAAGLLTEHPESTATTEQPSRLMHSVSLEL
jgi:hypothetical protein